MARKNQPIEEKLESRKLTKTGMVSIAMPSHQRSRTHASHWSHVTAVCEMANGRANVISFCSSFSRRSGSSAGEPIVVVRGGDGELRAFFNVCRHHAAAGEAARPGVRVEHPQLAPVRAVVGREEEGVAQRRKCGQGGEGPDGRGVD